MRIKTGYGRSIITPEKPMRMAGFDKRTEESCGTHDDLFVRCLLLEADGRLLVLISLDVLGVDEQLSGEIKNAVMNENSSVEEGQIFIFATHTHSGPSTLFRNRGSFDGGYAHSVVKKCSDAFVSAIKEMQYADIFAGTANICGIASKRNVHDAPKHDTDIKCSYLRIKRSKSQIMLINFPCHMTVLNENNRLYSRDLADGLEKALKARGINEFIYMNGAAGDISTRFYKKESSYAEADRLGRLLAGQLIDNHNEETGIINTHPSIIKGTEFLIEYKKNLPPGKKKDRINEINNMLSNIHDERMRRDLESAVLVLKRPDRDYRGISGVINIEDRYFKKVKINLVLLGDLAFIGLPFEAFYDTGIKIEAILKRKFGCSHVFLAGYCGGYNGYIPPETEFKHISYETTECKYEADTETRLLLAIENL